VLNAAQPRVISIAEPTGPGIQSRLPPLVAAGYLVAVGRLAERFIASVFKTDELLRFRGFESLAFRHCSSGNTASRGVVVTGRRAKPKAGRFTLARGQLATILSAPGRYANFRAGNGLTEGHGILGATRVAEG
jgi:hypothetical protein